MLHVIYLFHFVNDFFPLLFSVLPRHSCLKCLKSHQGPPCMQPITLHKTGRSHKVRPHHPPIPSHPLPVTQTLEWPSILGDWRSACPRLKIYSMEACPCSPPVAINARPSHNQLSPEVWIQVHEVLSAQKPKNQVGRDISLKSLKTFFTDMLGWLWMTHGLSPCCVFTIHRFLVLYLYVFIYNVY